LFVVLIAPGLLFDLLAERRRAGAPESAFREASRVVLASLVFSSLGLGVVGLVRTVEPTWMPDADALVAEPHQYLVEHYRLDAAHRKSPGLLSECPHPVAVLRLADGGAGGGVDEVGDRDGFGAVGAGPAEADTGAGLVAVGAPLLPVVAGVAAGAGVDRDVPSSDLLGNNGFGSEGGAGVAT